jgi:hypothetical protein
MKRRNICLGFLGVLSLVSPVFAQQTTPPSLPPNPVLTEAKKQQIKDQIQQIANTFGITGLDMTSLLVGYSTGAWQDWPNFVVVCSVKQTVGQSTGYADFTLDYDTGVIVRFNLLALNDEGERLLAAGSTPTITAQQAEIKVRSIINFSGYMNKNWQMGTTDIYSPAHSNWSVTLRRYVNSFGGEDEWIYANVDRFSGTVSHYSITDNSIRLPIQNALLPEATTRQNAINAYQIAGGTLADMQIDVSNNLPMWRRIPDQYPYGYQYTKCTRCYRFIVPNNKIEVLVDAETGEIWYVEGLVAGFSKSPTGKNMKPQKVILSKHIILSSLVLAEKKYNGLGRAVASGFPLKKMSGSYPKLGSHFSCKTTEREVFFTFDAKKHELYWETETNGKWSGVKLSQSEAQKLAAWLKTAKL